MSSEQPKEYIITDNQLKQIKELIFHEDEVKFEKLAWKIISRPHPAPALFQIEPNSHDYTIEQIVEINENIKKQRAEAARQAREDVLGLARDMYSLMMCVEKTNTDEFMKYYAERMKGLKEQYESLRSTTPHTEQEHPR